jgi:hypothetical protein
VAEKDDPAGGRKMRAGFNNRRAFRTGPSDPFACFTNAFRSATTVPSSSMIIVNHGGRGWRDTPSDSKGDIFTLVRHLAAEAGFGLIRIVEISEEQLALMIFDQVPPTSKSSPCC